MASDTSTINFLLLVELIVVVIAASAFLFYWNRLLGSLVALLIRAIAWRSHSAYVTIGSLQISPLAGRISFRDIEYHSSNLSVRALHGHITFRYWIFRVRQEADTLSDKVKRNRLPCRIFVYSEGVECFVFNRTPAYEAIVERMKKHEDQERGGSEETLAKAKSTDSTTQGEDSTGFGARLRRVAKSAMSGEGVVDETGSSEAESTRKPTTDPHALPLQPKPVKTPSAPGVNWLREALPLELHVVNGSLILGSDSTPTVMVGSFQRTDGTLEITDSRSACDEYKLSVNLNFEQPTVLLRTNVDYSGPILAHGKKVYDTLYKEEPNITKQAPSALSSFFGFHTLAKRFAFIRNPKFSSPPVAGLPTDRPWKGLARYRTKNDNVPKPPAREEREYAKVTTLVKADSLEFTYFADTPGPVPLPSEAAFIDETDEFGNVDLPPEYGIDLTIRNGIVNYGPWADRQRDALQRTFAPSIFFDSEPKPQLKPGDLRIHSNLIVNVQFAERTTLRIPTREPSKDWEHEHKTQEDTRTYGWLDVVVGSNSSITYTQSQFATKRGYDAILVLHLDTLSISSSVNYLPFLDAKTCKLSMTMPTPLSWNARRDWGLDITMDTPQVCLLRDHVQLISDLAKDWSSGATGDFHHFVPNHYNFRVTLLNYGVHLCLNDFNIIDAPLSREQNSYMDISGPRMESYVAVSVTQYRPDLSTIPFTVKLHDATVAVSLPTWDTHRSFSQEEAFEIGKIGQVSAEGSYTFYSTPHPDHQEMLTLHLEGKQVAFKALGWVLRRLFCTKDNYFGGFTQFATSGEFLERFDHDPSSVGDPVEQKYRPGRSDAFAVEVTMNVEESLILMSDEIFGCERGIAMPVPQLQMALKSGEHFMDLSLDAMPTYIVASDDLEETYRQNIAPPIKAKEAIFIEGLELRANRLFGPQPRATTYLCLWELVAPRTTAFLSPVFLETIKSAVSAVVYNFTDIENAPASFYIPKTPPDVTFFKLGIDHIAATLFADDTAVSVDMHEGVNLDTSSLATRSFSSAVGMIVPSMAVSMLEYDSYRRKWLPTGVLHTSLSLDVFNAPAGWQEKAEKQQQFLRVEDGPTQRIWYMYREGHDRSHGGHINNVYLPTPRPIYLKESDEASVETSSMDHSDERGTFIDYSSSGPSSDDGSNIELQGRTPGRKRSRSFSVVPDSRRSSLGDESDSVSEASDSTASTSATSSLNPGYDMAEALADRIKMFRSTQEHSLPVFPAWQDEGDSDIVKTPIQRSMAEGTIFRLSVQAIEVDLGVKPIQNGATLMRAIESVSRSPEIRLDQLLISHTEAIKDEGKPKDAALIDVTAPVVKIRLSTKIDQERVDTIEAALRGVSGSVLVVPESGSRPKELDVALGGRSMSLTVSTPNIPKGQVSLLGRDSLEVLTGVSAPVLKAQVEGLQVGFSQSTDQQMRGKAALIDVTAVTPAAVCLIDIAAAWRRIASGLQGSHKSGSFPARLIRGIIEEANSNQLSSTSPSFVFEGGYQLHAKDQRSIRRDPGWLMIARLRHWLRHMNQESLYQREADSEGNTAEWIISEMVRLEDAFCGDEALVKAQPFVKKALQGSNAQPRSPDQRSKSSQGQSVFVKLGSLALRHHGRLLQSGSVASSVFQLFSASAGVQKSIVRQNEQKVEHLRVLLAVRQTTAELHDSILPAVQELLKLARTPDRKDAEVAILNPDSGRLPTTILILDVQLENMQLSILAGGLRLRLAANNFQHASARRASRRGMDGDEDGRLVSHDTVFVCCDGIELALLQPQDDTDAAEDQPDRVVALLNLKGVRIKVDDRALGVKNKPTLIKMVFGVQNVEFDSRPQLRAFLTFARDWQKRHISRYRPIIHDIRYLVSQKKAKIVPDSSIQPDLNLDLAIGSVNLQVRAAKAVWLRWEIGKIYISRHGCSSDIEFGVRIAPQVVGAYSSMKKTKDRDVSSIKLPSLTAIGFHRSKHGRPHISATITLGFFVGVLKPAILDRLLSLHQRLGNDIMHTIQEYRDIIQEERSRSGGPVKSTSPGQDAEESKDDSETQDAAKKGLDVLMDLQVSVSGVRFGLRADDVTTTLLLEALALRGAITNASTENAALRWRAKVEHFGLSLGHLRSAEISDDTEPIRKHRSAYMVLDVEVQETPGQQAVASQLNVSLNRVHTVMHVAALSELSDLVRSWQSDIHILRDNRATEVAEVKSTTTKLLKKFEAADKTTQLEESWFASRLFTVQVVGFGVAIPLDEAAAIDFSHREGSLVPALLFSVRVVSFQNRKNETARFKVQRMALQFLDKFDQGAPEHFMGDYHPSINRMLLPSLDSEAQMSSLLDVWILSAHSSATDFKLSLAPDVVTGVFKLIDLYEHGKDRLAELEKHYRAEMAKRELLDSVHAKYEETPTPSPTRPRQRIVIRMSYTFNSGIVELHRSPESPATPNGQGSRGRATWHDSFILPTISVWTDYAGPKVQPTDDDSDDGAGMLVFNAAVHESRNTLRPTILPFFVDLVNRLERRQQSKPRRTSFASAERKAELVAASVSESTLQVIAPSPGSKIRLRLTLRIDRSELRLSCAPDSNAYVDLKWESGGFMSSGTIGCSGDEVTTFSGSISGVTASLSHEFADQGRSCVEAGAKDMAFSVAFCPCENSVEKGLSIVVDTQLSGQFRLDAFSAWLIFTSVWIDNAPSLDVPLRAAIPEAASSTSHVPAAGDVQRSMSVVTDETESSRRRKLPLTAMVRFRSTVLDANIAISKAKLDITPIILRTVSNGEKTEVDLKIGKTSITAKGDISGDLVSDKLVFNTMRRSSRASEKSESTVLSMSIDAGDLRGNLFLGEVNILRLHLEPAFVSLADDWKDFQGDEDPGSQVSLAFSVRAGNFAGVLRLLAIPRLLGNLYSVLDMVDSQQRIALQRSEIFKAHQRRKKEPSPVTAAILQTARRASAASPAHIRTAQTMRFDLAGIDIGVFNEDHESGGHIADFYRFIVGKVEADLTRRSSMEGVPMRDLGLLVSAVQWDSSDGARVAAKEKASMDARQLIDLAWRQGHKSVASLPSMTMKMKSQEISNPPVLDFDFDLVWGETDGDIGILPNFFEQAISAFRKLIKGIDEQELARQRRIDPSLSPNLSKSQRKCPPSEDAPARKGPTLEYRPRDPTWADDPPLPKLKQLGESTREAATFIPRIKSATKELPVLSHRFVTLPLEDGMDLLLKLYEKQLPERSA